MIYRLEKGIVTRALISFLLDVVWISDLGDLDQKISDGSRFLMIQR